MAIAVTGVQRVDATAALEDWSYEDGSGWHGRRRLFYTTGFPWEPGCLSACDTSGAWYAQLQHTYGANTATPCFTLWIDTTTTGNAVSKSFINLGNDHLRMIAWVLLLNLGAFWPWKVKPGILKPSLSYRSPPPLSPLLPLPTAPVGRRQPPFPSPVLTHTQPHIPYARCLFN